MAPEGGELRRLASRYLVEGPVRAVIESMNGARFVHDQLELAGWQVEIADAQKVKGLAPLACKTDKIDSWVLAERIGGFGGPVHAAIESMNGARFVHDQLELAGWQVEIADAQKVKGLAPLACKTDKIDAWVLAELSRRDLVPAIWLPTPAVRAGLPVAAIYKITYPSDRARARPLARPRLALHRAAAEQGERHVTPPFRHGQLRRVSHWISEEAPDAAELVLAHITRAR